MVFCVLFLSFFSSVGFAEESNPFPVWIAIRDTSEVSIFSEKLKHVAEPLTSNVLDTSTLKEDLIKEILDELKQDTSVQVKVIPHQDLEKFSSRSEDIAHIFKRPVYDFDILQQNFGHHGVILELLITEKGFDYQGVQKEGEVRVIVDVIGRLLLLNKKKIEGHAFFENASFDRTRPLSEFLNNNGERAQEELNYEVPLLAKEIKKYYLKRIVLRKAKEWNSLQDQHKQ